MSWILKKEEVEAGIEIEKDQFSFRKQYIQKVMRQERCIF